MRYIYIENYLLIPRDNKFKFLKYIYSFKRFKVNNQKVILNDDSLIIELTKESSFNIAKKTIDLFFKKHKNIKTFFIDELKIKKNMLYLFEDEKLIKSVDLK